MSTVNRLDQISALTISDSGVLLDLGEGDGTVTREIGDGLKLTLTIENGKLVQHVAQDAAGTTRASFRLHMQSDVRDDEGRVCFVCVSLDGPPNDYGGNQVCFRAPCKLM